MLNTKSGALGLPTFLGVLIVLCVGGVLAIGHTIAWDSYMRDAAYLIGLLGIAHGIDAHSRP